MMELKTGEKCEKQTQCIIRLRCKTNVVEVIPIDLSVTEIDRQTQAYYTRRNGNNQQRDGTG